MKTRRILVSAVLALSVLGSGASSGLFQDVCGPFTDVSAGLCPFVLEMHFLGITAGTSPTTFSPDSSLTRGQASVFVSKSFDQAIARSSRRAALGQWWETSPHYDLGLGLSPVGLEPALPIADGQDIWVPSTGSGTVSRIRASDGRLLETWSGVPSAYAAVAAMGRIFVTSASVNGEALYMIDPSLQAGAAVAVVPHVGDLSYGITFDGGRIWVANANPNTGSVAIVTPGATLPWTVTNVSAGFSVPTGILFDGRNIWVTDPGHNALDRLDSEGGILQQVTVGSIPQFPVFDGSNIWVPNYGDSSVTVVRAADGAIISTLTGNGVSFPWAASFDGTRVIVTNVGSGYSVSLWKAADLSPIGSRVFGLRPWGVCSDGLNFWIAFRDSDRVGRF